MPDWMETLPDQVEMHQDEPSPSNIYTDLPPGLQAIIDLSNAPQDDLLLDPMEQAPAPEPIARPEITALPAQASFQVQGKITSNLEKIDQSSEVDLEAISEFILQHLKKQHRHNNIVEAVCHRTGWHWNKSQRFVARVQTNHLDELQFGKDRIIIGLGVGIILVGLLMAISGAICNLNYSSNYHIVKRSYYR